MQDCRYNSLASVDAPGRLMTDLAVRRTVAAKRDGPDDYHTTPSPTTVVVGRAVGGGGGMRGGGPPQLCQGGGCVIGKTCRHEL